MSTSLSVRVGAIGLMLALGLALAPVAGAAVDVSGLRHLDGTEVVADELPTDVLFVIFSTWSPKCRDIAERAVAIQAEWKDRARVYLVNFQEDAAEVEGFLGDSLGDFDILLDRDAVFSKKHNITTLPSLLAVKGGVAAFRGKLPDDVDSVLVEIFD